LTVFRADDGGDIRIFGTKRDPLPGRGAIGVGLDAEHRVWLVNQQSSSATRVDIETGAISHFGAGDLPYTYSDFTGFALRRITAQTGFIRDVLTGCEVGPSEWEQLTVDADLPSSTRVQIRVRAAATPAELTEAMWFGPFEGDSVDLLGEASGLPQARLLEVEARLVSETRSSSPALRQIVVRLHCPL
jgi:hypothetical protein